MKQLGFDTTVTVDKKSKKTFVTINGRLNNVLKYYDDRLNFPTKNTTNKYKIANYLTKEDNNNFTGGTTKDLVESLAGQLDLKPFLEARNKIAKGKLIQKLKTEMQRIRPKRTRCMSEYDGEWSYDRRYDIEPFSSSTKTLAHAKVVTIKAHFGIACGASAKDIDTYGALVWSLCTLIEQAGVSTHVIWVDEMIGCNTDRNVDGKIEIELKKAGQYLAPSLLAATFKSNFFRRVCFSLISAASDLAGKTTSDGLGSPKFGKKPIEFTHGVLNINPEAVVGFDAQIEAEILKAIA